MYLKSHIRRAKAFEAMNKPLDACLEYAKVCVKEGFSKNPGAFGPEAEVAYLACLLVSLTSLLEMLG